MLNNQVMKIKSAVIGFKKVGDSNRIDYFLEKPPRCMATWKIFMTKLSA